VAGHRVVVANHSAVVAGHRTVVANHSAVVAGHKVVVAGHKAVVADHKSPGDLHNGFNSSDIRYILMFNFINTFNYGKFVFYPA
jgi:hypothetical protein